MPSDERKLSDEQYIASRYDGLAAGPSLEYTFETQRGIPYDGSNKLARLLSPFTIRLVPPAGLLPEDSKVDVNLIGRGVRTTEALLEQGRSFREQAGLPTVNGDAATAAQSLVDLRSEVSAGRALGNMLGAEQRSVIADPVMAADIRYQVEKMLQTPPLTLFINPNSLSLNFTTVQQYSQRTRYGYVFERWGEGQPTLSISGSTGAFAVGDDPNNAFGINTETSTATGVQFASKRNSAAFQQFMSLYQIYRNNGYIYDTVGKSEAHLFIGAVAIDYDQMTYVGSIDSFDFTYDEASPHRIEWSMEFTVGRMYDHAEEPLIVLPESSPTPSAGSLSASQLADSVAARPRPSDFDSVAGIAVTGTDQFDGSTPLEVLGSFPTRDGIFEP